MTHYILCKPCTPNLCDSQYTENRNNIPKSHLSVKRKSASSFTPNSSSCSRERKEKARKKTSCYLEMNSLEKCSFAMKSLAGMAGKMQSSKESTWSPFLGHLTPYFEKYLYHSLWFTIFYLCVWEFWRLVCFLACFESDYFKFFYVRQM